MAIMDFIMSEEASQIAEKRIEAKGKGEKGRYTQLNAEFQRIARSVKAFFSLRGAWHAVIHWAAKS